MPERSRRDRNSTRLPYYDYSSPGAYFVTICTDRKQSLFGEIIADVMQLYPPGQIAQREWQRLADRFPTLELDEYVFMPDHMHGILMIHERRGAAEDCISIELETKKLRPGPVHDTMDLRTNVPPGSLGAIIRAYKSAVTRRINRSRFATGGAVWQRNYYDRVIRDDEELNCAREYIINNPLKWGLDQENPENG